MSAGGPQWTTQNHHHAPGTCLISQSQVSGPAVFPKGLSISSLSLRSYRCLHTIRVAITTLRQLSAPLRPAPDRPPCCHRASAPGSQDWSPNSLLKLLVYLGKVLSWFPVGQRVQAPPHTQRGLALHTPAPPPRFILAPSTSQPLRCQVTQQVSQENSDIFSLLKGSSPPTSNPPSSTAAAPTSDKRPSLLWPTLTSDCPKSLQHLSSLPFSHTFPCVEPQPLLACYLSSP